jgi:hypothetical protein
MEITIGTIIFVFVVVSLIFFIRHNQVQAFEKSRRHIRDVKPGDRIIIEHWRMLKKHGQVLCINNDPISEKIFIRINWAGEDPEESIFSYDDDCFKNFNLLNPLKLNEDQEEIFDIALLQKKINEALEKEEYENIEKWQKQIDKLLKK